MTDQTYPHHSIQYQPIRDNFLRRIAILEAALKARHISYRITYRYRDPAAQAALYAQGRTGLGRIITNARPGQSPHNWDLAHDFVLFSRGKLVTNPQHPTFLMFETLVKAAALITGRHFKGLVDAGHVQHPRWKEAITWKPPKSR